MYRIRALSAVIIAAMLTACGSGGGGGSALPTSPSHSTSAGARGSIKITLAVPPSKAQSARAIAYLQQQQSSKLKRRYYLSGATTEIDFTLSTENGVAASPADQAQYDFAIYTSSSSECTGNNTNGYSCTITAPAPVGADTYVVQSQQCSVANSGPSASCSSLGGTLTLLSASYTAVNVVLDQTVVAAFTLSPIVASIDWATVTYANLTGPSPMNPELWLPRPNGTASPTYNATANSYTCSSNVGSGTGNGCFEPAAQGTQIAYGEVLEARDANGALIVGASGGTVYQTPLYLDATGNAISINWSCTDTTTSATIGAKKRAVPNAVSSLVWETGGGPFPSSSNLPGSKNGTGYTANQSFNSPVAIPANDPDGGNTVDGNGNPVTAVGNNGIEMNWDGVDPPTSASPDFCSASSSNGLSAAADFYLGLGQGGITVVSATPTPPPGPSPDATVYTFIEMPGENNTDLQPLVGESVPGAYNTNTAPITLPYPLPTPGMLYADAAGSLTVDPSGNLWVQLATYVTVPSGLGVGPANLANYILEYAPNSSTPTRTITQSAAWSGSWANIAVDPNTGDVYVGEQGYSAAPSSIDVYSGSANGPSSPIRSITTTTELLGPFTVDGNGNLWVFNYGLGGGLSALQEYSPTANGTVSPTNQLLDQQWDTACNSGAPYNFTSIQFDPQGNLVAYDYDSKQIFVFTAGFTDATCPSRFTPQGSTIGEQSQLAVDEKGYIYFLGDQQYVSVYPENATNGSSGVAQPYYSIPMFGRSNGVLGSAMSVAVGFPGGGSGDIRRRPNSTVRHIH